jgi:pimeloyl-ACP methyl ester carboxylesterase
MEKKLPTIICIHGHGTNGAIFRLQAARIVQALRDKFRFVFVDAPFTSLPGPGVVPVFSDFKPFLRWHCDENALGKFDITAEELEEERRGARELLAGVMTANAGDGDGVVGVMAFSQGTRVATGLLLDPELGQSIKFAIMICGTFPSLPVAPRDTDAAVSRENVPISGATRTAQSRPLTLDTDTQGRPK